MPMDKTKKYKIVISKDALLDIRNCPKITFNITCLFLR